MKLQKNLYDLQDLISQIETEYPFNYNDFFGHMNPNPLHSGPGFEILLAYLDEHSSLSTNEHNITDLTITRLDNGLSLISTKSTFGLTYHDIYSQFNSFLELLAK